MAGEFIFSIGNFTEIIVVSFLFIAVKEEFLGFEGHIAVAQYYIFFSYSGFSISFVGYVLAVHLQGIALLQHHISVSDYLVFFLIEHCQIAPHIQSLVAELYPLSIGFKNSCTRVFHIVDGKLSSVNNFDTFSFRFACLCHKALQAKSKH